MTDPAELILETRAAATPEPPVAPAPPVEPPPQVQTLRLEFTGTGSEYFRIWVVNLLLTIVTLGVYSAWAKVRKTRYFWSNTQLDGAAFQYHGKPVAILRGRILALVIFGAYSLSGRISFEAGMVGIVVLGVLAPWLFYLAMRFKLSNTTWRGLRMGFDSTVGESYVAMLPAVIIWVLFAVEMGTVRPGAKVTPGPLFFLAYFAFLALVPFFHARIKRYQHGAATCGAQRFEFDKATGAFYGVYTKAFFLVLAPATVVGFLIGVLGSIFSKGKASSPGEMWPVFVGVGAVFALFYMVGGAYFFARLQQVVWSRTHGGPIRFATSISASKLTWLVLRNGALTLVTLGLYWPFAAVNIARYQIECLSLLTSAPLATIAAGAQQLEPSAAGEGAVDFFGWDVGL